MTKYHARKVTEDGITFDSLAEYRRWKELNLLEHAEQICDLKVHVPYRLEVNGQLICKYVADFVYDEGGTITVEDVKGVLTPVYRLKKKLMKAIWNIDIQEITA